MKHAVIEVLNGPLAGMAFPLVYQELTIGRSPSCTICPEGYTELSRRHVEILWDGAVFVLQDAGSKNGIVYQGEVVRDARLGDGDEAALGDFSFRLHIPEGGPEFAGAAPPTAAPASPEQAPRPTLRSSRWGWAAAVVVVAIVAVVAVANLGGRDRSGSGTVAGVHDETYEVAEPDGVKGRSVEIVAGAQKQSLNGSTATLSMKNTIPQLVASVDSEGKPVLLAITPPGSPTAQLSAQSTAQALVYCTPFLCPADSDRGKALLERIQSSPEVDRLAQVLRSKEQGSLNPTLRMPEVAEALHAARRALLKNLDRSVASTPTMRLASWDSVSPTDEQGGIQVALDGNKLTIANGKRHWLVVTGLPPGNIGVVPSNPSTIDIGGLISDWKTKSTFDVSSSQPNLRVYAWSIQRPQYLFAQPQPDDAKYLAQSMAMTVFFDGVVRVGLTAVGDAEGLSKAPAAVQIGFDFVNSVLQGGLLVGIQNKLKNDDYKGALFEGALAMFHAVQDQPDVLKAITNAFVGSAADTLANIIGGFFSADVVQAAQIIDDLAALVVDNAGPAYVIGVTLQHAVPTVSNPPPAAAEPPAKSADTEAPQKQQTQTESDNVQVPDPNAPRTRVVPEGVDLAQFLETLAFPGSKATWQIGSPSLGVEIYRVQTANNGDITVRFDLMGPVKEGTSHGSGPWKITGVGPYDPSADFDWKGH